MSYRLKAYDNMEFTADDAERMQDYRIGHVDKLVLDAIHTGKVFAGFGITQSGASRIIVGEGRLYVAGAEFSREADTTYTFDLAVGSLTLPISQFKYFSLVGWGSTRPIDQQPREFETAVVDASGTYTGDYMVEQRDVATTEMRFANVDLLAGLESANPQPPTVGSSQVEIARILCSPTAIVAITYVETNRLQTIEKLALRMNLQELFAEASRAATETLISDFASMRAILDALPRGTTIDMLVQDMARVKEQIGRPDTATAYGAITFGNANEMDMMHPQSLCRIDGTLSFAALTIKESLLAFQNPNEPLVTKVGNLTLPVYTHVMAIDTTAGLNLA